MISPGTCLDELHEPGKALQTDLPVGTTTCLYFPFAFASRDILLTWLLLHALESCASLPFSS